jgi:hypothetical protein
MIWNGPRTLESVIAYRGNVGEEEIPVSISNDDPPVVTVSGYQPSTNDVIWHWVSTTDSGESKFHLSCSDDEMDGPEDCGMPQGNGKYNEAAYDNVWLLDGLTTDKGFVFDCTPQPPEAEDECAFEATPVPGCKTDPEVNDLTSITFRYTGADCSASDNDQGEIGDKWDCDGIPEPDSVSITVLKDPGETSSDKGSVDVGDTFTLGDDFSTESIIAVGGQTLTIHTSCSQPLAVGDVFGSLEVVGINGQSSGAEVTYSYKVTNNGTSTVDVTSVYDDKIGELLDTSFMLLHEGESLKLEKAAFISETTTNTVTVTANDLAGHQFCEATDQVTVTVTEPTFDVAVDIKPGSCPNPLDLRKKGDLPAAILGTDDFDVTTIDPSTITIAINGNGVGGVYPLRWAYEDVATPFEPYTGKTDCDYDCTKEKKDGYLDLTLKFNAQEIISLIPDEYKNHKQCIVLSVKGYLMNGTPFNGEDVVSIRLK